MYTGTLIRDLMATVERAEQRIEHQAEQRLDEQQELQTFLAVQIYTQIVEGNQVFVGAA